MKTSLAYLNTSMWKSFDTWLLSHSDPAHALSFILEVSSQFPREEINALFHQQLRQVAAQLGIEEAERQANQLSDFDYVGYIATSVRRAGFADHMIDSSTQDILVQLMIKPGQLFSGWDGKAPIIARFKISVKNAVINLVQKRETRRRRIPSVSIDKTSSADLSRHTSSDNSLLEEFRSLLQRRLGDLAVKVFDQRLGGGDIKDLAGDGVSNYALKQTVKQIKMAAREFAIGDTEFLGMVEKAFRDEARTVGKRFSGKDDRS